MNRCDPFHPAAAEPVDPRIEAALRYAIAIGAVLLLLLPAARGSHAALGWLPLWLLAMPVSAWWSLHRFALPTWPRASAAPASRRRRAPAQARRRSRPARPVPAQPGVLPRVA